VVRLFMVGEYNKCGDKMHCLVFAPSHITGFFEIMDHHDPLIKGSRGAGVTLDHGVYTNIIIDDDINGRDVKININGDDYTQNGSVSNKTLNLLMSKFSGLVEWDNKRISIKHQVQVPMGAGFGASAGLALGTALGVSKLMKLPLTFNQAAAVAHQAEVEMKTGLGDVMGALCGGLPLRLTPGAPGVGRADRILNGNKDDEGLFVIAKSLGTIETSSILNDPVQVDKINRVSRDLLRKLLKNPQISHLMALSLKFAQETGLMDQELLEIVEVLADETMGASMAMLGKTAFAISKNPDTNVENSIVAKVDSYGCRFKK
jgi:pantoate kinase